MKKLWIFISAVLVQLLVILSLTVYVNSSASKAVNWKVDGFTLTDDAETERLNSEIKNYLDSFNKYNDEDILYSHSFRIVSDTKNVSVVEISTVLEHNATEETKQYIPAGEVYTTLWVFNDNGKIKTNWVEKSNTAEILHSESSTIS